MKYANLEKFGLLGNFLETGGILPVAIKKDGKKIAVIIDIETYDDIINIVTAWNNISNTVTKLNEITKRLNLVKELGKNNEE